jgi:hypothetical protein
MTKLIKFSTWVRERAVRMVQDYRHECLSFWASIESLTPGLAASPRP